MKLIIDTPDAVYEKCTDEDYDICYEYGEYTDQDCSNCPHKEECSGFDEDE